MSTKNTPTTTTVTATPELATEEQFGHILDQQKRRMRGRGLTKDEANVIIRNGNRYLPVMDQAADVLIDRVRSEIANTIIRMVKVNRKRSAQETLDATGWKQYTDANIVATMPVGEGLEEVEMHYFKPDPALYKNGLISDADLVKEFDAHGLKPDPQAQADDNAAHPEFAKAHPNGTHWPLEGGGYGFLAFSAWVGGRLVRCSRFVDWNVVWVFGGVRKVSK